MEFKLAIIGLGQIGASIGLALAPLKGRISLVGYDRSGEVARKAVKLGAVEQIAHNPSAAVKGAEVVILALPINEIRATLKSIAGELAAGMVVMDTAPVKTGVVAWMEEFLPQGCHYVGLTPALNPMVLEEIVTGVEAARADLFQRGRMGITVSPSVDQETLKLVSSLITHLGAEPYFTDFAEVDGLMAFAHLLPGLAAAALTETVTGQAGWGDIRKLAGLPFVAAMRPLDQDEPGALAESVLHAQANCLRVLDEYLADLNSLRDEIEANDRKKLEARLSKAWQARDRWRQVRASGDWQSGEMGRQEVPDFGDFLTRQLGVGRLFGQRKKKDDKEQ